jgi:hypothetical protein
MKTIALLVATALTVSVSFATHTGQGELKELNFSLEGLPVYVQDARKGPNESLTNEYKLDTTTLEFLIKQSVDPDGWSKDRSYEPSRQGRFENCPNAIEPRKNRRFTVQA